MKPLFITGTDTDVGKTIATLAIGALLQEQGCAVHVMKPVQCAGDDAALLKRELQLSASLDEINPFYAQEPLSPHLAFAREGRCVDIDRIKKMVRDYLPISSWRKKQSPCATDFKNENEMMLIEGAGGVFVPIVDQYCMIDLIQDLDADVLVVARLGLGTINHTLMTVSALLARGLTVKGIVFSDTSGGDHGVAEQTNPDEIAQQCTVPVLGMIPHLNTITRDDILTHCRHHIDVKPLMNRACHDFQNGHLINDDKQYVWHPFTQMQDWEQEDHVIIDRGNGSYLIDINGNRYLDGVSSLWVTVHGHRKRAIDEAIQAQMNKISHSTLLGLANTPSIELAKKLVSITPSGLERVFYSDNGSTSVEIAIKMAYQYWQNVDKRDKINIVHLANSYHGDTLGSVSVGGIDLFHQVYRHMIFKTIRLDWPDGYRDTDFESALNRFESLLQNKAETIAALVVEPLVQGAAGMLVWPEGVLKKIRQLTEKYGIFLICDEVATGFGRTGTMFACEQENVSPDFLCLSKGITGGYLPLAATLTTARVYDGFKFPYADMKTFFHGHTYTGNPLACAAALANIALFEQEQTLQQIQPKIKHLQDRLQSFYNLSSVGDVRQKGLMVGIELVLDRVSKTPYPWQDKIGVNVCRRARDYGVILRPLGNVIVLMPPLSMTMDELDVLLDTTYRAIEEVLGG